MLGNAYEDMLMLTQKFLFWGNVFQIWIKSVERRYMYVYRSEIGTLDMEPLAEAAHQT